jgi:hypothetical protein
MKIEIGKYYLFRMYGNVCQRRNIKKDIPGVILMVSGDIHSLIREHCRVVDRYVVGRVSNITNIISDEKYTTVELDRDTLKFFKDKPDNLIKKD